MYGGRLRVNADNEDVFNVRLLAKCAENDAGQNSSRRSARRRGSGIIGRMVNGARWRLFYGSFKLGERYAVAIGKHDGASIAESSASDDRSGSQFNYLSEIRGQASNRGRYYRSRRL